MSVYVLAFLIGVIAGLRALTAPAAVSWAARLGWMHLENTGLAFMGSALHAVDFHAAGDWRVDQRQAAEDAEPKAPGSFGARIVTGALSGAALGAAGGSLAGGLSRERWARSQGRWAATRPARAWCGQRAGRTFRSRCWKTRSRCWARSGSWADSDDANISTRSLSARDRRGLRWRGGWRQRG